MHEDRKTVRRIPRRTVRQPGGQQRRLAMQSGLHRLEPLPGVVVIGLPADLAHDVDAVLARHVADQRQRTAHYPRSVLTDLPVWPTCYSATRIELARAMLRDAMEDNRKPGRHTNDASDKDHP